jgi:hypothetical protein
MPREHSPSPEKNARIEKIGSSIVGRARLNGPANACSELDRWELQLLVTRLIIPGSMGSPVNPIAIL